MGAGPAGDPADLIGRALRAQVGGPPGVTPPADDGPRGRLTTTQVLLIAAIVGVVTGMSAGLAILLG